MSAENAESTLLEFMSAMKDWENKFATLFKPEHGGPEAHGDQAEAELRPIYEKYVSTTKAERLALSAGYPPEFDLDAEKIVSTEAPNNNRAVIETLWTHPKAPNFTEKRRYTMINKSGEWRLDKKELYDSAKNKWVKRAL